ncbi:L-2-hydroxyglutarate dehydrogenase, mitochondrial [Amphibalanus amphitrite]|uniref:L-2-hydroxyglutarate dehydrogenase, mitochondrial n=1 Tax=Amphibalanus amphitrite TaxID=1232801 RepID=A0A6A4WEY7_AMPAM|nr:L-2-hydroxyglutarate dehydrogenase, mitochondrial [Amphibalanus amphitrite]
MTYDFCDQHNVPYRKIGKLIVALDGTEMAGLRQLHERGQRNGVPGLELLDANGLRHIAPHCTGVAALWSPQTGIVDWSAVTREYGRQFERLGGRLRLGTEVTGFEQLTEPSRPLLLRCGTQVIETGTSARPGGEFPKCGTVHT